MAYKRTKLNLGEYGWQYGTDYLKAFSLDDLKEEYSRLRAIAQKRLGRLSESEWTWTNIYQSHREGFPELSELGRRKDLEEALSELGRFVYSKESSVSGLDDTRRKSLNTLDRNGYSFVNEDNWREWVDFIKTYKKYFSKGSPTPEQLKEMDTLNELETNPQEALRKFKEFIEETAGPLLK